MKKHGLWLWGVIQNRPGSSPSAKAGLRSATRWLGTRTRPRSTGRGFLQELFLNSLAPLQASLVPPHGSCVMGTVRRLPWLLAVAAQSRARVQTRVQTPQKQPPALTPTAGVEPSAPPLPPGGGSPSPALLGSHSNWGVERAPARELCQSARWSACRLAPGADGSVIPPPAATREPPGASSPFRPGVRAASISGSGGSHCTQLAARCADGARRISQFQGPYTCHRASAYRVVTITCGLPTGTPGNMLLSWLAERAL